MKRVLLVHWNSREAADRVTRLLRLGDEAAAFEVESDASLRQLRDDPPARVTIPGAR